MFQNPAAPRPPKRKAAENDDGAPKRRKIETPVGQAPAAPPARRRVIGQSVLPAGLPLESRRYINKWSCFAIDLAGRAAEVDEPSWITARRALFTHPDRTQPELGSKQPGTVVLKSGSTRNSLESAETSVNEASGASEMKDLGYGKGAWARQGLASGPVPKGGRRDLQLLSQLSELLIQALAKKNVKTYEVEAMVVNGRILVSANEPATTETLATFTLNDLVPDYWSAEAPKKKTGGKVAWTEVKPRKIADICAALLPADPVRTIPAKVGLRRLIQLQVDCQLVPGQRTQVAAILTTLHTMLTPEPTPVKGGRRGAAAYRTLVAGGAPEAAAHLINDPAHAGKIIVVDAVNHSHAEQNLVAAAISAALLRTEPTTREKLEALGPLSVAGGKRPCSTCWLTLALARRYGLGIHCNWHPGGLWKGSTKAGMQNVANLLQIPKSKVVKELTAITGTFGYNQYVTDNHVTAPRSAKIENLPPEVRSTTRYSTVNDSGSESETNDSQTFPGLPHAYTVFATQDSQPLDLDLEPKQEEADPSSGADSDEEFHQEISDESNEESGAGGAVVPGEVEIVFDEADGEDDDAGTELSFDDASVLTGEDDESENDDEEPIYEGEEPDDWQEDDAEPGELMSIVKEGS